MPGLEGPRNRPLPPTEGGGGEEGWGKSLQNPAFMPGLLNTLRFLPTNLTLTRSRSLFLFQK